jgi:hypothetical protein
MAPAGGGAAAFDPSGLPGAAGGTGTGAASGPVGSGAGGVPGGYDGAAVPVSGALDGASLDEGSSTVTADGAPAGAALPLPALLAVVALAGATAALVRTHLAVRAR